MIVQNVATDGATEVSFTVATDDLEQTLERGRGRGARPSARSGVTHDAEVAKVSVVGLGMRTHTGVATTMFDALAEAGINIEMITTSEIKISVLVEASRRRRGPPRRPRGVRPRRAASTTCPPNDTPDWPATHASAALAADAQRLRPTAAPAGMEDLVVSGVELDEAQARITLLDVPDRPGYAARVFRSIAEADVFVDMIVQNVSTAGNTHLSFTVPRDQIDRARGRGGEGRRPRATSRSSRRSPSSRSSASACGPTPASPPGCSAPWPTARSTSP